MTAEVTSESVEITGPQPLTGDEVATTEIPAGEVEVRSLEHREIGALIAPWDDVVDTPIGLEAFERGAFAHVDPKKVVLRLGHEGPPVGRGISIEERADGAYMAFRVSKTQRGDEALTLAADGVTPHVSIEYAPRGSQGRVEQRGGRRLTRLSKVDLKGVATTYAPYYDRAAVTYVRDQLAGERPMSEQEAPGSGATVAQTAPTVTAMPPELLERALASLSEQFSKPVDALMDRLEKLEERSRMDIVIPAAKPQSQALNRGHWMQAALRLLSGERIADTQMRELADLVTTDNVGVVPDAYSTEIIGVIDPRRPFLQSTRRLPTPDSGMSLVMPKIVTRPTVATQANEKDELDSTPTSITTATFDAITKGGAGDISLQLLKRSSPSFLSLYLELLAEAYAIEAEDAAVDALLTETDYLNDGGELDPEDMSLGGAWEAAASALRRGPDTIWLSSAAVGAFINAKANGTNAPLYGDFRADFSAAAGVGGSISGLRPVWVPALDDETVDVIVGPSSGFAWAEDGTYTLQVDVPAKAGRDVAIVGILWFAPLYPSAFTTYALAGS